MFISQALHTTTTLQLPKDAILGWPELNTPIPALTFAVPIPAPSLRLAVAIFILYRAVWDKVVVVQWWYVQGYTGQERKASSTPKGYTQSLQTRFSAGVKCHSTVDFVEYAGWRLCPMYFVRSNPPECWEEGQAITFLKRVGSFTIAVNQCLGSSWNAALKIVSIPLLLSLVWEH